MREKRFLLIPVLLLVLVALNFFKVFYTLPGLQGAINSVEIVLGVLLVGFAIILAFLIVVRKKKR